MFSGRAVERAYFNLSPTALERLKKRGQVEKWASIQKRFHKNSL